MFVATRPASRRFTQLLSPVDNFLVTQNDKYKILPHMRWEKSGSTMWDVYAGLLTLTGSKCNAAVVNAVVWSVFWYIMVRNSRPTKIGIPIHFGLRCHIFRIHHQQCKTRRRKHAFSVRLVQYWNKLPEEIVNASSMETFKFRLDARWQSVFPGVPLLPVPPSSLVTRQVTVLILAHNEYIYPQYAP